MPKRYEEMKKSFIKKGMSKSAAAKKAAKITNASLKPGEKAVGSGHKKKGK